MYCRFSTTLPSLTLLCITASALPISLDPSASGVLLSADLISYKEGGAAGYGGTGYGGTGYGRTGGDGSRYGN